MTLVLAVTLANAAILCADCRVQIGPDGGPVPPGIGEKLFVRWGYGIATFGAGKVEPVPNAIRSLLGEPHDVGEAAQLIADRFAGQDLGAFVAGIDRMGTRLFRVNAMDRTAMPEMPEFAKAPLVWAAGVQNGQLGESPGGSPEDVAGRLLEIQRAVAREDNRVGPPFQYVILRSNEGPEIRTTAV